MEFVIRSQSAGNHVTYFIKPLTRSIELKDRLLCGGDAAKLSSHYKNQVCLYAKTCTETFIG